MYFVSQCLHVSSNPYNYMYIIVKFLIRKLIISYYTCNSHSTSIDYCTLASACDIRCMGCNNMFEVIQCMSINNLFLTRLYMYFCQTHAAHAQNMHAAAQSYCIILKPPWGRSKPESTLRAEASETQVATQPFCPWRRHSSYQKDIFDCH